MSATSATRVLLLGPIDDAHAPLADAVEDPVVPDPNRPRASVHGGRAWQRLERLDREVDRAGHDLGFARLGVVAQQGSHLVDELRLIARGADEPRITLVGGLRESLDEELLDSPVSVAVLHAKSSRCSQARASLQSLSAVVLEIPTMSAASSTVMPPKKRSSMSRA